MGKKGDSHHVVPNPAGGWDVKKVARSEPVVTTKKKRMQSMPGGRSAEIKTRSS